MDSPCFRHFRSNSSEVNQRRMSTRSATQGLQKCWPLHTMRDPDVKDVKGTCAIWCFRKYLKDGSICYVIRKQKPGVKFIEHWISSCLQEMEDELNYHGANSNRD